MVDPQDHPRVIAASDPPLNSGPKSPLEHVIQFGPHVGLLPSNLLAWCPAVYQDVEAAHRALMEHIDREHLQFRPYFIIHDLLAAVAQEHVTLADDDPVVAVLGLNQIAVLDHHVPP